MDKIANAYRTISEVAADLALPQHVLRFWETRFTQIKPLKRGGGRRYYRPDDIELLRTIQSLLYNEGYTIKGVQRILREQNLRLLLNASREAREAGTPISLYEPEPKFTIKGEASDVPFEDVRGLEDDTAGPDASPKQNSSVCASRDVSGALPEGVRHTLEALLLELIECRRILDKAGER